MENRKIDLEINRKCIQLNIQINKGDSLKAIDGVAAMQSTLTAIGWQNISIK